MYLLPQEVKNMSELKPRITENGSDYILVGEYCILNSKLPEKHRSIGKHGMMTGNIYEKSTQID